MMGETAQPFLRQQENIYVVKGFGNQNKSQSFVNYGSGYGGSWNSGYSTGYRTPKVTFFFSKIAYTRALRARAHALDMMHSFHFIFSLGLRII